MSDSWSKPSGLIGMVHLAALPGTPSATCSPDELVERAVADARRLRDAGFEQVYIPPAPGDDGGAIGAALWAYHHLLGKPRGAAVGHAYFGSEYSESEIGDFLKEHDGFLDDLGVNRESLLGICCC